MGGFLGMLANKAPEIAGGILGMALQPRAEKRQWHTTKKFQNLQIQGAKELADYQQQLALDSWEKTNYKAQVEQLQKAGLNPALIYGMGGEGGTLAAPGGGMPTAGVAEAPSHSARLAMDMAFQMSQMKLVEAQKEKTEAETENIKGVERKEAYTRIANIIQDTKNKQAQEAGQKILNRISELDEHFQRESLEDRLKGIQFTTKKIISEWQKLEDEVYISNATKDEIIESIRLKVIESYLTNANLGKDIEQKDEAIKKSKAEREKITAEIRKWASELEIAYQQLEINHQQILQGWENLDNQKKQTAINEFKALVEQEFPSLWNVIGKWGNDLHDNLINTLNQLFKVKPYPSHERLKNLRRKIQN